MARFKQTKNNSSFVEGIVMKKMAFATIRPFLNHRKMGLNIDYNSLMNFKENIQQII